MTPGRILALMTMSMWCSLATAGEFTGTCVKVIDGNTIEVSRDKKIERVRLIGIDAPEPDQKYGRESRAFLSSMALNKSVRVMSSDRVTSKPITGLVVLEEGKVSLNSTLVRNGCAKWIDPDVNEKLRKYEIQARSEKRGIWSVYEYVLMNPGKMFSELKKTREPAKKGGKTIYLAATTKPSDDSVAFDTARATNERESELEERTAPPPAETEPDLRIEKGTIDYELSMKKSYGWIEISCKIKNHSNYPISWISIHAVVSDSLDPRTASSVAFDTDIPPGKTRVLDFQFEQSMVSSDVSVDKCKLDLPRLDIVVNGERIDGRKYITLSRSSLL